MSKVLSLLGVVALAAGSFVVVSAGVAGADVSPTTTADDGSPGSLREILENLSGPETVVLEAGATYDLTLGGDINIADAAVIEGNGATIRQTDGASRVLDTGFDLTLRNVTITGGVHDGPGAGVRLFDGEGTLRVEGSTITGNVSYEDSGGGIFWDGPVFITNSTVSNNSADNDGGGLVHSGPATIVSSTFSGNCAQDDSGAIDADAPLTIVNSTITENTSDDDGAIGVDGGDAGGDFVLVYSDIVENTLFNAVACPGLEPLAAADPSAGDGEEEVVEPDDVEAEDTDTASNLFVNGGNAFTVFGSVIGLPILAGEGHTVPAFNCNISEEATVVSLGYNFSDDDTCAFTADTDTEDGGDPLLGPLGDNGGPTLTRLPLTGSPLLDAIPLDACGDGDSAAGEAITTDQRGLPRPAPDGFGCEIGSVEVQPDAPAPAPIVLIPTFTG